MRGRIEEAKIQEIRERIDIVDVVSSYLPLKRSGANHLGLCPFHGEKTPSFNVNAPRQIFHCFGCGVGGNVFSFLMRMEGLSFPEAVRRLGERVGVEVEEEALSPAEEKSREEAERLVRINEVAGEYYHRILLEEAEGAPGRRYLRERGYDGDTARQFRLGYAPERWDALAKHLETKGFDPALVREKLGLIRAGRDGRSDYDLFRRRLLFPILDARGQVVAFGGRVLDGSLPKYINSPESPVYHKGRILYGLYEAKEGMRQTGEGIVVEGYFDQMALRRAGFGNVVATCGTALTEDHARLLKRYAKRLLLLFDQDSAGQKATFRAMEALLAEGLAVAVVTLEAGEDPDSYLLKRGSEAFRERLQAARPVIEVFMETVLTSHGDGVEGRARAVEEIMGRLALLPSDIERSLYLKALAERTGIEEELLRRKAQRPAAASRQVVTPPVRAVTRPAVAARPTVRQRERGAGYRAQDLLLQMMDSNPQTLRRVVEEGIDNFFSDQDWRAVAERLVANPDAPNALCRLLDDDRLGEEQKALVSGILIKDQQAFAEDPEGIFADCRQAVDRERLKKRSRELPGLIREAESGGDHEKLVAYHREQIDINRKLKK
jgi:DNA primase